MAPARIRIQDQVFVLAGKTTKQKIVRIGRSGTAKVEKKPTRVWTIATKKLPELPVTPQHLYGFFMEDELHDWKWSNGTLRYFSRLRTPPIHVLLEFE